MLFQAFLFVAFTSSTSIWLMNHLRVAFCLSKQIDPGNLEVDMQAGAAVGYNLLFALLFTSILGFVLQALSAHVTLVTGFHLAELCRAEYPLPVVLMLFTFSFLSVLAFDVAPVIGTAFALQILCNLPLSIGMVLSALDTIVILFLQRKGRKSVEIIVEGMLALFGVCVLINFALSRPELGAIIKGTFIPDPFYKPSQTVVLAVGILGSVVMSHNLFLHSGVVKLRHESESSSNSSILLPTPAEPGSEIRYRGSLEAACSFAVWESAAVLLGSFVINGAVLSIAAAQFFPKNDLPAFQNIGLQNASVLLHQVMGTEIASYAWAVALLCSGHAATVTGTLASQFLCQGFLVMDPSSSIVSLVTRCIAIVPAVTAAIFTGSTGADNLVVACQIVISFALPMSTIPLLKFANHPFVAKRVNNLCLRVAGVFTFAVAIAGNIWIVWDSFSTIGTSNGWNMVKNLPLQLLSMFAAVAYISSILYLVFTPVRLPGIHNSDELSQSEVTPFLA